MSHDEDNPFEASEAGGLEPSPSPGQAVTVRRIDPLSLAKLQAAVMCVFAIIFGVFWTIGMMLGVSGGPGGEAPATPAAALFAGLFVLVGITLFYVVFGFLSGLIMAAVYNAAAGFFGGIKLELDTT